MRGTEIAIAQMVTARIRCLPSKIAVSESSQFPIALPGSHPCLRCLIIYFEASRMLVCYAFVKLTKRTE
jgi:hypothetical protein